MVRHLLISQFLLLAICSTAFSADSVIIVVRDVPDDFFQNAVTDGSHPFNHSENAFTVVGKFVSASFAIPTVKNITLYDANSNQIPLTIEESSIHREFDDISEIRFSFEIDGEALAAGPPRLEWGSEISADNIVIEKILIDGTNKACYKTFAWEELPAQEDCDPQMATLEVIVDDKANLYYLWYLLPMGLIFGMLVIRKIYLGKASLAAEK